MKCTSKVPVWRKRWWNVIGFIAVSAMLLGPVLACGSGPTTTVTGPTVTVTGPTATVPGPTATVAGPTTTVAGPTTTVTGPAVTVTGPTTTVVGPWTKVCDVKEFAKVVPADTTVTSANLFDTPVRGCKVEGYVTTKGPGPNSNKVNFMVALPDDFNGRFFFVGVGGTIGRVPEPPKAQLTAGYAVAGTDGGNTRAGLDYSIGLDPTMALDYASRGTHVSTVAAKEITNSYYYGRGPNRPRLFSYITGCSGGARQGFTAAEVYPKDFDGVLISGAGAPDLVRVGNALVFGHIIYFLQNNPASYISPATLATLEAAVVKEWDAVDGAVDGIVAYPWTVTYDGLVSLNNRLGILTEAQLKTARLFVEHSYRADYARRPANLPTTWASIMGATPPPWQAGDVFPATGGRVFQSTAQGLYGLNYDWLSFDFNDPAQIADFFAKHDKVFQYNTGKPDPYLSAFKDAGGKLLYMHGTGDILQSAMESNRYYNDLARYYGGIQEAQKFARFVLVPGLGHCSGGIGPQDVHDVGLAALANWVEKGQAPTTFKATNPTSKRTFLLCVYPQVAIFKGGVDNPSKLDVNDYSNWACGPLKLP